MLVVFWLTVLFLFYTLAGYPLALWVVSALLGRTHRRAAILPSVSAIIAAHNEAGGIAKKIRNTLELAYPPHLREVIVASDASDDETVEIANSFGPQGVQVIDIRERRGKQFAQLQGIKLARGEVLVFTDAAVELDQQALQNMVSNFADPSVGCVSSEDQLIKRGHKEGEQSYVNLEMWIRRHESRLGSLVSASGSFFAARRSICETWPIDQTSDFFVVLNAVKKGMRAVVDPQSIGRYGLSRSDKGELRRKVRTIVNGLEVFFTHLELVNPFRYGLFSWQLVSHKLFRWLVPVAVLVLFVSNAFLWGAGTFYRLCFVLQAAAYLLGLLALAADRVLQWKPTKLAGYFVLGTAATLMAWFYFLSGEKFVSWQPTQRG